MGKLGAEIGKVQNKDISQLNPYEKTAKIGLAGLKGGLQNMPQAPQVNAASPIQIQQAPQVDPSYFQPNRNRFQQGPDPNDLFFGRGGF